MKKILKEYSGLSKDYLWNFNSSNMYYYGREADYTFCDSVTKDKILEFSFNYNSKAITNIKLWSFDDSKEILDYYNKNKSFLG